MTPEELIAWAGRHVLPHWRHICDVADRMVRGEQLTPAEREVIIPLVGARADYGALFGPLADLLRAILPQPMTLTTIIHSGGRIVRAYREEVAGGHFVRIRPVDPREPSEGWRKIADLRFFEPFARLGSEPLALRGWRVVGLLAAAARQAIVRGWIDFDPPPRGWRWIRIAARWIPDHLPVPRIRIALVGRREVAILRLGGDPREPITESADVCARYAGLGRREAARRIRHELGGPVLAVRVGN